MTDDSSQAVRSQTFLAYLIELVSILIGLILVLLVFSPWLESAFGEYAREIKTSAAGSGMTLILLSFVRIAEKIAWGQERTQHDAQLMRMNRSIEDLRRYVLASVQRLREDLKGTAANRIVFDRSLKRQVSNELSLVPDDGPLSIDVVGFTLFAFYQDYFRQLENRANTEVRILIQDPAEFSFDLMAKQEARDPAALRNQIRILISEWNMFRNRGASNRARAKIEIRLFPLIATISGNRVNGTWYIRNRVLHEASNPTYFFERYIEDDKEVFSCVQDHFNRMWEAAREPPIDIIK